MYSLLALKKLLLNLTPLYPPLRFTERGTKGGEVTFASILKLVS